MRCKFHGLRPDLLAPALLLLALCGRAEAAGGAFAVDDSEIGNPGECKVESWISFAGNHDRVAVASPACVARLAIPVELGGQFQRARSDGEWNTSAGVKGKINFIPVEKNRFGIGLGGGTSWDFNTGQNTGGFINVPVTFQVLEQLRLNLNGGWQYDATAKLHRGSWGAGFEWTLAQPVTLIGEVYGVTGSSADARAVTQPRTQLGLRFTPVKAVDLDLIWGRNITGENAHWVTIGLNLRF